MCNDCVQLKPIDFAFSSELVAVQEPTRDTASGNSYPRTLERPTCLFIQMELCKKDTLKHWLEKTLGKRERKVVLSFFHQVQLFNIRILSYLHTYMYIECNWVYLCCHCLLFQILEAVAYIHGKDHIHRDLKPSNIFFSLDDDSLKVGDFGLVAGNTTTDLSGALLTQHVLIMTLHCKDMEWYIVILLHCVGERQARSRSSQAGTFMYMAPEQIEKRKYNEKVDIFALGVIFFELNCPLLTDMERFKVYKLFCPVTNLYMYEPPCRSLQKSSAESCHPSSRINFQLK